MNRTAVFAAGVAVALGAMIGFATVPVLVVSMAFALFAFTWHRRVQPATVIAAGYLAIVLLPDLTFAPSNIQVAGISLYLPHLLLPLMLISTNPASIRQPIRGALALYFVLIAYMGALGLARGAELIAVLQDIRGPLTFFGGVLAGSIIHDRQGMRGLLRLVPWILSGTVALILLQLVSGLNLLGGRVGSAVGFGGIGQAGTAINATRFIVNAEDLAVGSLLVLAWLFVQTDVKRPSAKVLLVVLVSSILIIVLSLSRQLLVGLLVGGMSWVFLRSGFAKLTQAAVKASPLLLVGILALSVATIAGVGAGSESLVGRQIDGFSERVLGGLTSEGLSEDAGSNWRSRENALAIQSLEDRPFGTGLGLPYRDEFVVEAFGDPTFFRRWVHNVYLWYATKGGYLGFLAVALVSAFPAALALRRARSAVDRTDYLSETCFPILMAFAAMSLVDPVIVNSNTGAITGMILALLASPTNEPRSRSRSSRAAAIRVRQGAGV